MRQTICGRGVKKFLDACEAGEGCPRHRCVLLKRNNRAAWDRLFTLMDHNKERFAKDPEAVKMYRLVTDFFLIELKLDFVTKEEIEHMIGMGHKFRTYAIWYKYDMNIICMI